MTRRAESALRSVVGAYIGLSTRQPWSRCRKKSTIAGQTAAAARLAPGTGAAVPAPGAGFVATAVRARLSPALQLPVRAAEHEGEQGGESDPWLSRHDQSSGEAQADRADEPSGALADPGLPASFRQRMPQ